MTEQSATYIDAQGQPQPDRRKYHRVREILDSAWELIAPMLASQESAAGLSGFAVAVKLRSHFPELSEAELNTLVSAAMRLKREERRYGGARPRG